MTGTFDPLATTAVQEGVVLTWKKFAVARTIPACVRDMKIDVEYDWMMESMVMRARGYVLGEQLPSHTETATGFAHFEAPASWWQHVKHQHGHRWWLRSLVRWRPVRMAAEAQRVELTATWEQMAAYPWNESITRLPTDWVGDPVRLSWLTSSLDWEGRP
jgi:hypothetical protein